MNLQWLSQRPVSVHTVDGLIVGGFLRAGLCWVAPEHCVLRG